MKNIHITDSYLIWDVATMDMKIRLHCHELYNSIQADKVLNRTFRSMHIEWWLHNIGYYLTLPFCKAQKVKEWNLRFKDVDLEEWEEKS